ncbi:MULTISPECIES: methionine aminotransferase [unclassified Flavobacterium]|uniref:methionine aminotransferase n=1 Tax=unclassified Flavobacterium TaxID=196869 RepID=UPI000868FB0F|nr:MULTISPECIES: methionine aminotransferase [unclassified Flavobacterium]MBN9285986.1 aminotransferase class I/II-fold pyridoxal phosphate-dependent enzyme [Flavobacterium sp.]ODS84787.1 MAG: methionine aminotransferase [Chryseobacterium sp. SCN 40-13]OJV68278.1 MAG: methionine aminotransferase [Flavobacterium sp. 40-81]
MSKLPHITTSIFTVMSQMANEHQAINLSQGFPNFPVDERLTTITAKLATENVHQYTPMAGHPGLMSKIAALTSASYHRTVNPATEMLVTAGATEAIFATIQALINKNEEVIILDPSYDCYEAPILLSYAKPVRVALNDDYTPDWEAIAAKMNTQTRMLIINNPHNPTGKIWTAADFLQLEKLLALYPDVLLLSDEVYEYITYEQPHISVNTNEKLRDRSIVISSFGKSLHITGWKIGYAIAPEHLMKEIKKVHQFLVFSVNSISQAAISDYLDIVDFKEIASMYRKKRDYFKALLSQTPFEILPCEGSYFQVASYASFSNENDIDFTKRLITDYGVATIPISTFYADGKDLKLIRFCFAKDDNTLLQATERLRKITR